MYGQTDFDVKGLTDAIICITELNKYKQMLYQ